LGPENVLGWTVTVKKASLVSKREQTRSSHRAHNSEGIAVIDSIFGFSAPNTATAPQGGDLGPTLPVELLGMLCSGAIKVLALSQLTDPM